MASGSQNMTTYLAKGLSKIITNNAINTDNLLYINTSDSNITADMLAATNSIAFTRMSTTGAYTTGHMVWLNAADIGTPFQLVVHDSSDLYLYKRWKSSGTTWTEWTKMRAGTADTWTTARTLTIGNTGKSVDGSANVSWSKDEILGASTDAYFLRGDKAWSNSLSANFSTGTYILAGTYLQAKNHMYLDAGHFHMKYNNTWYPVLHNHGNGNISVEAASGGLYIGYSNTTLVNWMNGRMQLKDGCLSIFPNSSNYREGIRIHSVSNWSDITLCGNDNTGDSGISANSWFIGNNNGNFYITRYGSTGSSADAQRSEFSSVNNQWCLRSYVQVHKTGIYRSGLHIYGPTYGNTAADMASGTAGLFSWNDGGPQITFDTNATPGGSQAGALIFTDHDTAATGVSWHFVSNQTDWNVTSKRFHARTSISIGSNLPNTSYNFVINGTANHTTGYWYINGGAGGIINGAATNGGINSIRVGDDVWLGDCNQGGIMGMKSTGTNCGFWFYNSSGTNIGQLYCRGGSGDIYSNKPLLAPSTASSWLDGQRYERGGFNLTDATDTGSYWPWMRQTNTSSAKWFSMGILNNSWYLIGSPTSKTDNGYASGMRFDISTNRLYATFEGRLYGGSSYVYDRTNTGTATYLNYGAAGLAASAITWLTCWNGYELRAISKAEMANAVDSAHKWVRIGGDTMTGALTVSSTGNNRATVYIRSAGDVPMDLYLGSKNTNYWSISCRESANPYLGFYWAGSSGGWALLMHTNKHVEIPVHAYVGGYNNTSYSLSTASFICNSWIRTTGSTGWYNESHGGGWYMTDDTWIRSYNNKSVYVNTGDLRCDGSTWGGKLRMTSSWLGFYSAAGGGTRYGYIECDVNRMYFRKENSSSQTHYFDFGSAVYIAGELNSGGVRARGGMMALSEANSGNCAVWFVNSTNTESYWKAAVQSDKEAFVFYRYSGTTPQWRFAIRSNGTTSTSSSRKIKHNIQDINFNTGYIIDRMKPVSYIVNGDTTNQTTYGFIYEDLVQVLPNVCVSSDGNVGIMYTTIIPILTKEIQNLRKRLAAVETELNYYRSKI